MLRFSASSFYCNGNGTKWKDSCNEHFAGVAEGAVISSIDA
jgi:hypothetical protein